MILFYIIYNYISNNYFDYVVLYCIYLSLPLNFFLTETGKMQTLERCSVYFKRLLAINGNLNEGNFLNYNINLVDVPDNFVKPSGYHFNEHQKKILNMRKNSSLGDILEKNITSEDLHTHFIFQTVFLFIDNNGNIFKIKKHGDNFKAFDCHDINRRLEIEIEHVGINPENKDEYQKFYIMRLIDGSVYIDVNILSSLIPNVDKAKKDENRIWENLSINTKTNTHYLTGSACIRHIELNELMIYSFKIRPDHKRRHAVADGRTNSIQHMINRKYQTVAIFREDTEDTTPLEETRSKCHDLFKKTLPNGIFYTNKHNDLTTQYEKQCGDGELTNLPDIFFRSLNTFEGFAVPKNDENMLHYPVIPSLGAIDYYKREKAIILAKRHMMSDTKTNVAPRLDLTDVRKSLYLYKGFKLDYVLNYCVQYFHDNVTRQKKLDNMTPEDDPLCIYRGLMRYGNMPDESSDRNTTDDNVENIEVYYDIYVYKGTNLNFRDDTVLHILIDKRKQTETICTTETESDRNRIDSDTVEPSRKRSRICDDHEFQTDNQVSDVSIQVSDEHCSDGYESDNKVTSEEEEDSDDSSYRPGSSDEDSSISGSSNNSDSDSGLCSDDFEIIAQHQKASSSSLYDDDGTMVSSLTGTTSYAPSPSPVYRTPVDVVPPDDEEDGL